MADMQDHVKRLDRSRLNRSHVLYDLIRLFENGAQCS